MVIFYILLTIIFTFGPIIILDLIVSRRDIIASRRGLEDGQRPSKSSDRGSNPLVEEDKWLDI